MKQSDSSNAREKMKAAGGDSKVSKDGPSALRSVQSRVAKLDARRTELAEATLRTLAELGYAHTSLRDIAQNSNFSHGVLHYYFADKVDLICCGVVHYKNRCAARYDDLLAKSCTQQEFIDDFCLRLEQTLRDDPKSHRLWYDLRSQALFEPAYREEILTIDQKLEDMTWRIALRYAELGGARGPEISSAAFYALLDGLLQRRLLQYLAGDVTAAKRLGDDTRELLKILTPSP